MSAKNMEQMMTIKDMTAMFQVNAATIYRHVNAGKLPKPFKVGGATRWHPQVVREFLDQKLHAGA